MNVEGKRNEVRFLRVIQLRIALAALLALFVFGCASSNSSLHYYLLHNTSQAKPNVDLKERTMVVLHKITLPDYLKQRGLVFQMSETNLHIATAHLWAEPLDEGITKSLSNALRLKDVALILHGSANRPAQPTLTLVIDDFIPTWEGDVVLSGSYTLLQASNSIIAKEFYYTIPLEGDGFSMSVQAMRKAIGDLANDIASFNLTANAN